MDIVSTAVGTIFLQRKLLGQFVVVQIPIFIMYPNLKMNKVFRFCKCNKRDSIFLKNLTAFEGLCSVLIPMFLPFFVIRSLRCDPIAVQAQKHKLSPFMETSCNNFVNEYKHLKADYQKLIEVTFFNI